ncbi:MAG: hypothetical protein OEW29_08040 [Acidimicrobiia bacterium]|nr:hypothetical protein [Acidimicrobiia bacterium]
MLKRRSWLVSAALVALGSAASCSSGEEGGAGEARVLAEGTVEWGNGQPAEHFDWNLAEIAGFTHAVTFNTISQDRLSTRSAARQGPDDDLWFTAAALGDGAPVMVFGGAADDVDQVVLVDAAGAQLRVDLEPVPDRDWQVAVAQLPAGWPDPAAPRLDVVGLADGAEVAREPLAGLS